MFRRSLSVHRSLSTGPAKPPETRRERIVSENWLKQSVAEAIGTFALIFVGVLSISAAGIVGAPGGLATLASIGLAHGRTLAARGGGHGRRGGGDVPPGAGGLRHRGGRARAGRRLSAGDRVDPRAGHHGGGAAHRRRAESGAYLRSGARLRPLEQSPRVLDWALTRWGDRGGD